MNKKAPCPNCNYTRSAKDQHIHQGICPSCGIAYAKWKGNERADSMVQEPAHFTQEPIRSSWSKFADKLTFTPDHIDPMTFWGRVTLWVVFALWGLYFIVGGVDWERIGGSFLHNINLPFHEFGHVLFSPFGQFMMILGGSLFQIMMPLIALVSFSWQMRDNFAAAIMLWWCGQNMIDVSPYIADAQYRALPLIRGLGEEYHDWGNLLTMLGWVDNAPAIANTVFGIGSVTILIAMAWAVLLLKKQKSVLDRQ